MSYSPELNNIDVCSNNCAYDPRMIITGLNPQEIIEYALKLKQVERYNQDGVKTDSSRRKPKNLIELF